MQQSIDLHPCFPSERQQCGQSYYESEFDAEILGIKQDLEDQSISIRTVSS